MIISFFIRQMAKMISRKIDRIIGEHSYRETVLSWIQRNNAGNICSYFDSSLLETTYIIETDNVPDVSVPTFVRWFLDAYAWLLGSDALEDWSGMDAQGITLKDTIFIHKDYCCDWIVFHELVHAVQWRTLGDIDFISTYGLQLIKFSYDEHPLEDIAYDWEAWYKRLTIQKIEPLVATHARAQKKSLRWV